MCMVIRISGEHVSSMEASINFPEALHPGQRMNSPGGAQTPNHRPPCLLCPSRIRSSAVLDAFELRLIWALIEGIRVRH
jgi:lysozyme family protein